MPPCTCRSPTARSPPSETACDSGWGATRAPLPSARDACCDAPARDRDAAPSGRSRRTPVKRATAREARSLRRLRELHDLRAWHLLDRAIRQRHLNEDVAPFVDDMHDVTRGPRWIRLAVRAENRERHEREQCERARERDRFEGRERARYDDDS